MPRNARIRLRTTPPRVTRTICCWLQTGQASLKRLDGRRVRSPSPAVFRCAARTCMVRSNSGNRRITRGRSEQKLNLLPAFWKREIFQQARSGQRGQQEPTHSVRWVIAWAGSGSGAKPNGRGPEPRQAAGNLPTVYGAGTVSHRSRIATGKAQRGEKSACGETPGARSSPYGSPGNSGIPACFGRIDGDRPVDGPWAWRFSHFY